MIVGGARPLACVGAAFLSLMGAAAGEARATPLTVSLEYAAGPGCPDAADFKAVVIARLGYDPFIDGAPDHVLVRIAGRGGAIDGHIEWRDAAGKWAGEQTFPSISTDCPGLARAMGFALAVQIQFLAKANVAPHEAAAPAAAARTPDAVAAPPFATPPVAPTPASQTAAVTSVANLAPTGGPRPMFAVGAGPSVGFGLSSSPVLLGRIFGAVVWPHVSIELAAVASLPTTTRRPDGAGVSQQHLFASAAGCAVVTRWTACLVANAGVVGLAGEDIERPTAARVPIVATGVRLGVIERLGDRIFLNAHADGLANLIRWTASLDNVPVWSAPPFGAAIGVDAGVRFP